MAYAAMRFDATDEAGNLLTNVTVSIRKESGAVQEAYSNRAGTVSLGSTFVSATGKVLCFLPGNAYRVTLTKGAWTRELQYVAVGRAAETDLQATLPSGAWDSGDTYDTGSMVYHDGFLFISMVDDNLNNEPDSTTPGDTTEWMFAGTASNENASILTTRGDILVRGASSPQRLPVGANGKVLGSNGTDPAWVDPPSGLPSGGSNGDFLGRAGGSPAWRTPAQARSDLGVREVLTANRTYYVRTDGNDANDGSANTSGGAFLTLQKAMDVIGGLDCSIYNVTVNVAAGTYTAGLTLKTFIGSGTVIFTGDTSNPSNVHVNVSSGNAFSSGSALGNFTVQGFKWTSGNTQDFRVSSKCIVTSVSNEWAGTSNYRIYVSAGAYLKLQGASNKISGGGIGFFLSEGFGYLEDFGATFTITANLTYSGAFGSCRNLAYAISLAIFTLGGFTVTGPRYSSTLNSVMVTSSSAGGIGGANHFPGNSAGSTATGGQYS